jgi:hypothetical protein
MKYTKTWKIGEYAKGGVISVEIESTFRNGNVITIIGKEWDSSQGYKKNSNQSNAKEFIRTTIHSSYDSDAERKMFRFLNELTTSYYVGNIIEWIKTKISK